MTSAQEPTKAGLIALEKAVLKLADLRICQGRLEEAQVLLSGFEDQGGAALPLSRLYLARGEATLARALLEQTLPPDQAPALDQAPQLRLLVDVLLALGDTDAARLRVEQLTRLANLTQSDIMYAQAELARGQVKRCAGEDDAGACYQRALERLHAYEQSLLAGRVRLEMARLVFEKDRPAAITWAKAALATFERIGAARCGRGGSTAQAARCRQADWATQPGTPDRA